MVMVLLAVRVRYVLASYPPSTSIVQLPPGTFNCDVLLERQPTVLQGIDATRIRHLMGYLVLFAATPKADAATKQCASAAYTLLWPRDTAAAVDIVHPRFRAANAQAKELAGEYVRVQLQRDQTLVVPFAWTYQCSDAVHVMQLWDVTHAIARLFLQQ